MEEFQSIIAGSNNIPPVGDMETLIGSFPVDFPEFRPRLFRLVAIDFCSSKTVYKFQRIQQMETNDTDRLFQSTAQLQENALQVQKKAARATLGDPVVSHSKVLDFSVEGDAAFVAESSGVVRRVSLNVSGPVIAMCH